MRTFPKGSAEARRFRFMLLCIAVGGVILGLTARYKILTPPPQPFRFPSAEMAAIDRDLQARFAVVPDKEFGIERTYGNQHYLYNPRTPAELATIAKFKKQRTEVAFYLMSRALWMRSWDGAGYKPIQGPVVLTQPIKAPLPRRINFESDGSSKGEILSQDKGYGVTDDRNNISAHTPDGLVAPTPTPVVKSLTFDQLQALGNRMFEMAESAPKDAALGISETLTPTWKVVAVPIRATNAKCLPCHVYNPMGRNPKAPTRDKAQLGDALGVAFYLYNTPTPSELVSRAVASQAQR